MLPRAAGFCQALHAAIAPVRRIAVRIDREYRVCQGRSDGIGDRGSSPALPSGPASARRWSPTSPPPRRRRRPSSSCSPAPCPVVRWASATGSLTGAVVDKTMDAEQRALDADSAACRRHRRGRRRWRNRRAGRGPRRRQRRRRWSSPCDRMISPMMMAWSRSPPGEDSSTASPARDALRRAARGTSSRRPGRSCRGWRAPDGHGRSRRSQPSRSATRSGSARNTDPSSRPRPPAATDRGRRECRHRGRSARK